MQSPIGISDFRKLIETRDADGNPYLFVDKSLFIKEILDDLSEVKLITRPRRFGKTLNMSMLYHFLVKGDENELNANLFQNLKIAQYREYVEKYQGRYPVVYITFKDIVRENEYSAAYKGFCNVMSRIYTHYQYLLTSPKLAAHERKKFEAILEERATLTNIQFSLLDLTRALYLHHGIKPWVLIDEYDTPIQTAYAGGYYNQTVDFMRGFLGAGLKDNSYLEKGILTGILRVSKESIFSGLNNIKTYSLLHPLYGEYFGFTESEVASLLEKTNLSSGIREVKNWYNGYEAGKTIIYNPWSIINYIKEQGKLGSYWVNMSDNSLIREVLLKSSTNFKSQFESLLQNKPIEAFIDEHITFNDLSSHDSTVWSLLLMSGYLKATLLKEQSQGSLCLLQIPNYEVKDLYRNLIARWLSGVDSPIVFSKFIENLLSGKIEDFSSQLQTLMLQTFSVHDISGKAPEKFFHGFMLGLISGIDPNTYQIHSNKESGYGRFDIAIIPNDVSKLGIIFEIKSIKENNQESLEKSAKEALKQIHDSEYTSLLKQHHIKNCLMIGVAFSGKDLAIESGVLKVDI